MRPPTHPSTHAHSTQPPTHPSTTAASARPTPTALLLLACLLAHPHPSVVVSTADAVRQLLLLMPQAALYFLPLVLFSVQQGACTGPSSNAAKDALAEAGESAGVARAQVGCYRSIKSNFVS